MSVNESLLSSAVNRIVDRTAPVNEVVLGTPVRGTGHTSGMVLLDFSAFFTASSGAVIVSGDKFSEYQEHKRTGYGMFGRGN